jgi:isopentenyl-diphosphate delta-isomerase
MIGADAIAIHLNFLQEAIQPEGDHNALGCLAAIGDLCQELRTPVIIKETGCGISAATALQCWGAGVSAIDIGGWGGTSWAAVESIRADESRNAKDQRLKTLGKDFSDWGIPTVVSLAEVLASGSPVIASGGVRTGLDIAKGLALGASLCGMALPLLKPAMENDEALDRTIDVIHQELVAAMFLTGSAQLTDLKKAPVFITGRTRQMIGKENPARIKR